MKINAPDEFEDSNDNIVIPTNEEFDLLLDDINQDFFLSEVNQSLNDKIIELGPNSFDNFHPNKTSFIFSLKLILYRIVDMLLLINHILIYLFFFVVLVLWTLALGISLYSVIIIIYVFFISSIVSYTMAPIYKSLSHDWLNFSLSFLQVISTSSLIAFYIYFILISVIGLANFIIGCPKKVKGLHYTILGDYNSYLAIFFSTFFTKNYQKIFNGRTIIVLLFSLLLLIFCAAFLCVICYVLFCFDKLIIIIGAIIYLFIIIQIICFISPSYVFLFQTLFGIKCNENIYIKQLIDYLIRIKKKLENLSKFPLNLINNSEIHSESISNDSIIDEISVDELKSGSLNRLMMICEFFFSFLITLIADSYFSLYYYSLSIAFDRHKQILKRVSMFIFLLLNFVVISYDIYQLFQNYSNYLLTSIIIRFIFVPLFSYYNLFVVLYYKAKDETLKTVNLLSVIFTFLIIIIISFGYLYINLYQKNYRINDLDYFTSLNNITVANEKMLVHPICDYKILDVSAFDSFGYALSGFDVKRNKTVFENQLKIFFGENYSNHITYIVYEIDKYFLFLKFYDSDTNTHIFAFRGYNSEVEIAFQFELFASHYIIPFFEHIIPLYEFINDNWLRFYTNFLNSFGLKFFENRNSIVKYVESIKKIYYSNKLDDEQNVLFTGINCGGVIAKIVGTMLYRKSISFISFSIEMEFLKNMFNFSSSYISYVTNIFNANSYFSHPESNYAVNIGIEIPIFDKTKFCTASICQMFSKADNIYRTICTMSEICGKGNQFNYYCEHIIGKRNLDAIRKNLMEKY